MSHSVLFICQKCNFTQTEAEKKGVRSGFRLLTKTYEVFKNQKPAKQIEVRAMSCFGLCKKSCAAAIMAEDKFGYLMGELDPDYAAEDLVEFAICHANTPDGIVPKSRRNETVKNSIIARIPLPRLDHNLLPLTENGREKS